MNTFQEQLHDFDEIEDWEIICPHCFNPVVFDESTPLIEEIVLLCKCQGVFSCTKHIEITYVTKKI